MKLVTQSTLSNGLTKLLISDTKINIQNIQAGSVEPRVLVHNQYPWLHRSSLKRNFFWNLTVKKNISDNS